MVGWFVGWLVSFHSTNKYDRSFGASRNFKNLLVRLMTSFTLILDTDCAENNDQLVGCSVGRLVGRSVG